MIFALIVRDVRRGFTGAAWLPIAFFLLVATLVPFAIGPDAPLLGRIGSGALWIAALTAALLPIERLIEPDRVDGVLDQLFLHGVADETIAAGKIAAHWLTFGPMLFVAAFPAAALLDIDRPGPRPSAPVNLDRNSGPWSSRPCCCGAHRRAPARRLDGGTAGAPPRHTFADLRGFLLRRWRQPGDGARSCYFHCSGGRRSICRRCSD